MKSFLRIAFGLLLATTAAQGANELTLERDGNWLLIKGAHLPEGHIRINYLEAYCRAGSTKADWVTHTVIPHTNHLLELSADRKRLRLRDDVADGLIVHHLIEARGDEVVFSLVATNPTPRRSEAHWAQPCVRLGSFTGYGSDVTTDDYAYLPKCFIFLKGKITAMPTEQWATQARYTPGQVWRAPGVPADDVNPRPLNPLIPSRGLIGCFSGDSRWIWATAWDPYQELFQGVGRCLHSDFRLGRH